MNKSIKSLKSSNDLGQNNQNLDVLSPMVVEINNDSSMPQPNITGFYGIHNSLKMIYGIMYRYRLISSLILFFYFLITSLSPYCERKVNWLNSFDLQEIMSSKTCALDLIEVVLRYHSDI